jgi:hypothetical protein
VIVSGLVRYHDDLGPLMADIDSVRQHEENYNLGDVDEIAESIEVNGMYRPIYAQLSTGQIIAGNHTWEACKSLGASKIPVVMLDVDDDAALRIMVADNELARKARRDNAQLVGLLNRLAKQEAGLHGTGIKPEDLTVLTHLAEMNLEPLEFAVWPTLSFQVHPRIRKAFMHLTREADTDPDRFELLMRLAGWDGS